EVDGPREPGRLGHRPTPVVARGAGKGRGRFELTPQFVWQGEESPVLGGAAPVGQWGGGRRVQWWFDLGRTEAEDGVKMPRREVEPEPERARVRPAAHEFPGVG